MSDVRAAWNKAARDFDDYQLELTGDVGKISRFLSEGDERSPDARRKKLEDRSTRSRLANLLTDPIYRAHYDLVWEKLRHAESAVTDALKKVDRMIDAVSTEIEAMERNAARLPDGTLVFHDKNGDVRQADGSPVQDDLAETIICTGTEPSFEVYQEALAVHYELQTAQSEFTAFENSVLGPARERLENEDDPPSLNEINDILGKIEQGLPELPNSTATNLEATQEFSAETIAAPTLPKLPIN